MKLGNLTIFGKRTGYIAYETEYVSFHFFVKPEEDEWCGRYKEGGKWLWGRDTEIYDSCLEYFGLGPFLFIAWQPIGTGSFMEAFRGKTKD